MAEMNWTCAQFGAREFYSIPEILDRMSVLGKLYTDIWCDSQFLREKYSKFASRYNSKLKGKVCHNSVSSIFNMKFGDSEIAFDQYVAKNIRKTPELPIFFTYSYGSIEKLKAAKEKGAKIVYGQINPGPIEADIVKRLYCDSFPNKEPEVPTEKYWKDWEKEIAMSDDIIVNSEWSKKLLVNYGINGSKISIIPLIYDKKGRTKIDKKYPTKFNSERKLRVLYLGAMSVRKGFHLLTQVFQNLKDESIQLDVVGRVNGPFDPKKFSSNIKYHGSVSPIDIDFFMKEADVFILPTYSDGFALTQLEAQNYNLPIITTPFCGNVITHGSNGFIIEELNIESITAVLKSLVKDPALLQKFSNQSNDLSEFSFERVSDKFNQLHQSIILQ